MQTKPQTSSAKNTLKNNLIKLLIVFGFIAAITIFNRALSAILGNFTSTFSGTRTGYTASEDKGSFSASYLSLNGTIRKKISPKGDSLHISVETKSGTLGIEIQDAEGNILFEKNCGGTEQYDVPVSGSVTVRIKAEGHCGKMEISSEP